MGCGCSLTAALKWVVGVRLLQRLSGLWVFAYCSVSVGCGCSLIAVFKWVVGVRLLQRLGGFVDLHLLQCSAGVCLRLLQCLSGL